jgi:hypothetical protein
MKDGTRFLCIWAAFWVVILGAGLLGSAFADDHIIGPTVTEPFTHARDAGKKIVLTGMYQVCAALGIDKAQCTDEYQLYGFDQIDKGHWYEGTEGNPDNVPSRDCYHAVAITRYVMWDGRQGTTYACVAPPVDDTVTPAELDVIVRAAKHLNSIGTKTLREHEDAMSIKQFAKTWNLGR